MRRLNLISIKQIWLLLGIAVAIGTLFTPVESKKNEEIAIELIASDIKPVHDSDGEAPVINKQQLINSNGQFTIQVNFSFLNELLHGEEEDETKSDEDKNSYLIPFLKTLFSNFIAPNAP